MTLKVYECSSESNKIKSIRHNRWCETVPIYCLLSPLRSSHVPNVSTSDRFLAFIAFRYLTAFRCFRCFPMPSNDLLGKISVGANMYALCVMHLLFAPWSVSPLSLHCQCLLIACMAWSKNRLWITNGPDIRGPENRDYPLYEISRHWDWDKSIFHSKEIMWFYEAWNERRYDLV